MVHSEQVHRSRNCNIGIWMKEGRLWCQTFLRFTPKEVNTHCDDKRRRRDPQIFPDGKEQPLNSLLLSYLPLLLSIVASAAKQQKLKIHIFSLYLRAACGMDHLSCLHKQMVCMSQEGRGKGGRKWHKLWVNLPCSGRREKIKLVRSGLIHKLLTSFLAWLLEESSPRHYGLKKSCWFIRTGHGHSTDLFSLKLVIGMSVDDVESGENWHEIERMDV